MVARVLTCRRRRIPTSLSASSASVRRFILLLPFLPQHAFLCAPHDLIKAHLIPLTFSRFTKRRVGEQLPQLEVRQGRRERGGVRGGRMMKERRLGEVMRI